jgi:hypothetical protein
MQLHGEAWGRPHACLPPQSAHPPAGTMRVGPLQPAGLRPDLVRVLWHARGRLVLGGDCRCVGQEAGLPGHRALQCHLWDRERAGTKLLGEETDTPGRRAGHTHTHTLSLSLFLCQHSLEPSLSHTHTPLSHTHAPTHPLRPPPFPQLLLFARAGVGFSLSGSPAQYTLFMEWLPSASRGRWLVLFQLWWTLGSACEVLLAWAVLNSHGWRLLVALSAVPFGE